MDKVLTFAAFFLISATLFGLMQWRLVRFTISWVTVTAQPSHRRRWRRAGMAVLILGNLVLLLRLPAGQLGLYAHPLVQALIVYPGGFFFASMVFGFLLLSVRDLVSLVMGASRRVLRKHTPRDHSPHGPPREEGRRGVVDLNRRRFLRSAGIVAAGSVVTLPVVSSAATARDYQVNRVPLRFENLPAGLEGLTLAQVSDIHSGIYMTERNMREIFEIVQSLDADIIVLTGDQVDSVEAEIEPMWRAIAMLRAEYGVFGVLGNHDHYANGPKVSAAMEQRHITMLNNAHRTLTIDGAPLSIVGIDDAGAGARNYARLAEATAGIDRESLTILLSHRPTVFPAAKKAGMALTLAGHTHGGQVGLELPGINLNPVYLVYDYARGLYTEQDKHLYVNVGVGMVGVPIRLVRPEIALFTLTAA